MLPHPFFGPVFLFGLLHIFLASPDKQMTFKLSTYTSPIVLTLAQTLPLTEEVHPLKISPTSFTCLLQDKEFKSGLTAGWWQFLPLILAPMTSKGVKVALEHFHWTPWGTAVSHSAPHLRHNAKNCCSWSS